MRLDLLLILFTVAAVAGLVAVLPQALWLEYRKRFRVKKLVYEKGKEDEALQSLVADVRAAKKFVVVACRQCRLNHVTNALRKGLLDAIAESGSRGVTFLLIVEQGPIPPELKALAQITIMEHDERLPFYGRIVDGRIVEVERSGGTGTTFYPLGDVLRVVKVPSYGRRLLSALPSDLKEALPA